MAMNQDFTAAMKDMMGAFPVDTSNMGDAFKNTAALNEKLSSVALGAAEKSAEVSSKWAKETLAKLGGMSTGQADPADFAKSFTDFASASAEVAAENMAAFAEIAKKVSSIANSRTSEPTRERLRAQNEELFAESVLK